MPRTWMGAATRALMIVLLGLTAMTKPGFAQVSTDVIRGRVTDPDAHPVAGVEVKVTSYQGQITKTTTTDKNGRFTIIYINGEGDYWINLRKLGFAIKRYEIKKIGDEEVMLADARLSSAIVALDAVNVVGQRDRALPNRNSKDPDVGGGDRPLTNNGLPPDQAGNLAAMAAAVAGFQLIPGLDGAPDMYSVLGLSGDQNNVTFNGLGSGISALPPDVLATTSINPYPFDVSKGGFSGAQIAIQTIPGSNFSRRSLTNVNVAPPLNVRLATMELAETFTDLPEILPKSLAVGTPTGLQLPAVDQLPPVGPTYVRMIQLPSLSRTETVLVLEAEL